MSVGRETSAGGAGSRPWRLPAVEAAGGVGELTVGAAVEPGCGDGCTGSRALAGGELLPS